MQQYKNAIKKTNAPEKTGIIDNPLLDILR